MTSKATAAAAAAAGVGATSKTAVGAVAKLAPRDIDESIFIVNNCQAQGELEADEVFNATVHDANSKFALEKGIASYEAHYDDVPYDKNNPQKSQVPVIDNSTWMTNLLPVPSTLMFDTQPKKMLKMEMKGYKKAPWSAPVQSLLNAVERRSMRRVMLGHHILMGGIVSYPGYDPIYDEIADSRAVINAAIENLKVDELSQKSTPKNDDVTLKTFPTYAIVHIERPDGAIEARHAVPELVLVTVAGYITLLNSRIAQTIESTHDTKRAQYIKMIQQYITKIEEWLASDPKRHSTSTVLTLYNYSIVGDNKLNDSEAFQFVAGPKAKPHDEEKTTANWHYILSHKNTTNVVAEFRAKVREFDHTENGDVVVARSDKEQLEDEANRVCTVALKFAVPIVPPSYLLQWKNTDAGKQAIADGIDQGKKKRAPKKAPATSAKTKKAKTVDDADDGGGDDEDDADDADNGDEVADGDEDAADGDDEEDDEPKAKKAKPAAAAAAVAAATTGSKGKPSKAEIGEQGTANDTAKKVKSRIIASTKLKVPPSKDDESLSADSGGGGAGDDDDGGDDDGGTEKASTSKSKKAKKTDDEEKQQIASHSRKMSKAKLEMEEIASHAATLKAPKSDAESTTTTSKKKKRSDNDDDEGGAAAAAAVVSVNEEAAKKVVKKGKKESDAVPAATTTTVAAAAATTEETDDKPITFSSALVPTPNPLRFFFRRRMLETLAEVQQQLNAANLPEDDKFPQWLEFEATAGDNIDAPWDEMTTNAQDVLTTAALWLGLDTLFIDAHTAVKARDDAECAREAAAASKREAEEAAAAAAAAAEEKRREAEEVERKRKEKEAAAEKKRKEEASAAAEAAAKKAAKAAAAATVVAAPANVKSEVAAATTPSVAPPSAPTSSKARLPGESMAVWMARVKSIK